MVKYIIICDNHSIGRCFCCLLSFVGLLVVGRLTAMLLDGPVVGCWGLNGCECMQYFQKRSERVHVTHVVVDTAQLLTYRNASLSRAQA